MAIANGEQIVASDYINESEKDATPANDEGKVAKLESDGRISNSLLSTGILHIAAGEDLEKNDALYLTSTPDNITQSSGSVFTGTTSTSENSRGQTFTLSEGYEIFGVTVYMKNRRSSSQSGNVTTKIYETSGGLPTGSPIATKTTFLELIGSNFPTGSVSHTFDNNPSIKAGVEYALTVECDEYYITPIYSDTNVYADGNFLSYATGSWVADETRDLKFILDIGVSPLLVKKASATSQRQCDSFIGFADETVLNTENCRIRNSGIQTINNLKINTNYYLSDTAGEISETQGTVEKKIGKSVSDNDLLIINN